MPVTDAQRRHLRKKRDTVIAYKASRGCQDCGETDPVVLELDHREAGTKTRNGRGHRKSMTNWQHLSWTKLAKELEKCDVVCANCHRRRTAIKNGWAEKIREVGNAVQISPPTPMDVGEQAQHGSTLDQEVRV